ncbi:MAG: carboxypeptidase regulatory-like domain-containing protein [Bacteroidales bacterium]|nr:carboxypeptidase regulatory-like domain-containing protein [Bacteroidales bacterium]
MKTRILKLLCLVSVFALAAACVEPDVEIYGSISGLVKNGQTGEFVSGVKVALSPGGASQITTADGAFSFENLDSGEYTISFTRDGFEDESAKVSVKAGVVQNVQISMIPIQPKLTVSTNVLNFAEDGTSLSLDITNSGKGTLNWEITENVDWIECAPMSGSVTGASSPVVVTADRSMLDQGNYSGSFVIASNGGSETIVVSITVNGLTLEVEPAELDFGTVTGSLQLTLTNTAAGSLSYKVDSSNSWLIPSKTSGTVSKTDYITVVVTREGLSAGKYDGTLVFSTNKGALAVPVKMEVVKNEKPTVAVETSGEVTYNSARLYGTVVSVGSEKITRFGFCWSEKETPTLDDNYCNLGDCSTTRSFDSTVSGLESETKYYFRAYAENNVGLSYSDKVLSFTTGSLPSVPGVTTEAIDNITSSSARAKGNITSMGNLDKITRYGHVWSTSPSPTLETGSSTNLGELTTTSSFTSKLEGLSSYTTYYVRAYASNAKGTAYGKDVAFVTGKGDPEIETSAVTEIVHNAATCGGRIVTTGGHEITEYGICWGKSALPTFNGPHVAADEENAGAFQVRLEGLDTQTVYYVRAYIRTTENYVFYGSDVKFSTTKEIKLPTLDDVTVSQIKTDGAAFYSKVANDGGSTIEECGFCWGIYPEPDIADNVLKCDPKSKEMSKVLSSLEPGSKYYVRAFAKNSLGIAYSNDCSFTTLALTVPEMDATTVKNVGRTKAKASSAVLSDGNAEVTHLGFCYSEQSWPTVEDNVVYGTLDGAGFKAEIVNLKEKTTYYIRSFAINSVGAGYGEVVSFTTTDEDWDEWDGSVASGFGGGSGTYSDPILINTAAQLAFLAKKVNDGSTYSGVYFKLTSALSLSGKQWTPIGKSSDRPFKGVFDGDNHQIADFSGYTGLFWNNGGTILNVRISGVVNAGGNSNIGGIAGSNSSSGKILNCESSLGITSTGSSIGGICGGSAGFIDGCVNKGEINGKSNVGGIAGYVSSSSDTATDIMVNRCYNTGMIKGNSQVGGVFGCIVLVDCNNSVYDCQNSGSVSGSSQIGGIVGYVSVTNNQTSFHSSSSTQLYSFRVSNCNNIGAIEDGSSCGGICGEIFLSAKYASSEYYSHGYAFYLSNSANTGKFGLIGKISSNSSYNTHDYSGSYWLYDIVNDLGQENARCDVLETGDYYTRTASACYLKGDTSKDIVTLLNNWVAENSGHLSWKYGKSYDGYARPELFFE